MVDFFCHLYRAFIKMIYCFCFFFGEFIEYGKICTTVKIQIIRINSLYMLKF